MLIWHMDVYDFEEDGEGLGDAGYPPRNDAIARDMHSIDHHVDALDIDEAIEAKGKNRSGQDTKKEAKKVVSQEFGVLMVVEPIPRSGFQRFVFVFQFVHKDKDDYRLRMFFLNRDEEDAKKIGTIFDISFREKKKDYTLFAYRLP